MHKGVETALATFLPGKYPKTSSLDMDMDMDDGGLRFCFFLHECEISPCRRPLWWDLCQETCVRKTARFETMKCPIEKDKTICPMEGSGLEKLFAGAYLVCTAISAFF